MKSRLWVLPLRLKLVAALVLLAGVGLLASGFAVTSAFEASMIARVDGDLHDAAQTWAKPLGAGHPPPPNLGSGRPPSPYYFRLTDRDGEVRLLINDQAGSPSLPTPPEYGLTTVDSADGSGEPWRVLTTNNPDGSVSTVGKTLTETEAIVDRLILLQFVIGGVVLVLLGVAGYFVVRRSLRPLQAVERTAAAIAAGDLNERVPESDPRTEVGGLSVALNTMLARIQEAFTATEASEESARRSEERMRRFVADASHELRTPLTTIRGFAELYRQGASDDTDMILDRIESESRRMGLLVEDLLMLARLDEQRPIERRPVDLLAIAADAVHGARVVAPGRAIALEILDGPGIPEVIGDDIRLRQVLGNLVTNAVTHTPADTSVTVRVGTVGDDAVLEVVDNGQGLSEIDRERVFERFYRTDSSRSRSAGTGGGSGLGLSIVAALVAAHNGIVEVDSIPGEGSTFRVRLRRLRPE